MTPSASGVSARAPQLPDATRSALARLGTVLNDKWRLDSLIGLGGHAAVYAATHRSGLRAAVKLLHPEYKLHDELRRRLNREARVLSMLDHPGAVAFVQQGTAADGSLYVVMELLEGETVASYLARKGSRLDEDEARRITVLVLDTLRHAHDLGIVHRDIKPDNVFITRTGWVKLLDFGIARRLKGQSRAWRDYTREGAIMGTPSSMSPEQALGLNDQVDPRSDIWAVGALLFEMLTGWPVHFRAQTVEELLESAASRPAPSLVAGLADYPGISRAVAEIVDRALAFEKEDRFRNAAEMRRALLATIGATVSSRPQRGAPRPRQSLIPTLVPRPRSRAKRSLRALLSTLRRVAVWVARLGRAVLETTALRRAKHKAYLRAPFGSWLLAAARHDPKRSLRLETDRAALSRR